MPNNASKSLQSSHSEKLTPIERKIHGISSPRDQDPDVSLKYYDPKFECFSQWNQKELKSFSAFVKRLSTTSWTDTYKSSGRSGEKVGFGMAYHKNIRNTSLAAIAQRISAEIKLFELRVSQRARVHGFRSVSTFFLVCLDRNHEIYPQ